MRTESESSSRKLFVILIDGPMGAGKTTTSKLLNTALLGSARIALADIKRLVSGWEENEEVAKISRQVIQAMVRAYLKEGVLVIVECITKPHDVETYASIAQEFGALFVGYRLTAPRDILVKRIQERTRKMMDVATLPALKITELDNLFTRNYQFYVEQESGRMTSIDTSLIAPEAVVNLVLGGIISV